MGGDHFSSGDVRIMSEVITAKLKLEIPLDHHMLSIVSDLKPKQTSFNCIYDPSKKHPLRSFILIESKHSHTPLKNLWDNIAEALFVSTDNIMDFYNKYKAEIETYYINRFKEGSDILTPETLVLNVRADFRRSEEISWKVKVIQAKIYECLLSRYNQITMEWKFKYDEEMK